MDYNNAIVVLHFSIVVVDFLWFVGLGAFFGVCRGQKRSENLEDPPKKRVACEQCSCIEQLLFSVGVLAVG